MDTDRLLRELTTFLRIPSVSTNPSHNADCRTAAEWVAGELRRLGCREVQFLASGTHPVVWGVGPEVPGAPTLLIYGHYDVQPPEPLDEWTTPPFEPTVRDGKLFARGAADDKGQVFCLLKAIAERGGRPPVNFRFLIEGEEEYGSRVLFELLRREPERTRADAVLIADMAYIAPHWPAVYTTLRGLCYAEITVRTAKSDLHSGEFGGGAQRARRARSPARPPEDARRQGARPRPVCVGAASIESRTRHLEAPPVPGRRVLEAPRPGEGADGAQVLLGARAPLGTPDLRDPRNHRGLHGGRCQDRDPGGSHRQGEPAPRARPEAQGGRAPAHGGGPASRTQARPGEREVLARRGPGQGRGDTPGLQAARSRVPRGRRAGYGASARRRVDSGGPRAREGRRPGHPHRHRAPRRPAARAE